MIDLGLTCRRLCAAAALLALGACSEDFEPYQRLTSLRVLAIETIPVAPATGETTTATPLVYTRPGTTVTSHAWSWCPFPGAATAGYPCLVTAEELAMLAGLAPGDIPPFDLGTAPTAQLENRLPPPLLAAVCGGVPGQPALLDCRDGFPAQLKLMVRTDAGEELVTVRTLRLRFDPATPANANPTVTALTAETAAGARDLAAGGVVLPRDAETVIRAAVAETDAERYPGQDVDGNPAEERERLTLSWFVESGDLENAKTGFIDGITTLADATENTWEPALPDDYPRDEAELIVVVRDGREGVAWLRGTVGLAVAP